jgi:gliding motility-associated-like protein
LWVSSGRIYGEMKNLLYAFTFVFCFFAYTKTVYGQASACPQVTVAPAGPICSGNCVNLTATVQGSVATTSYSVASIPYSPYPYNSGMPVLINIDDTWSGVINMPFCFEFFGNTYNKIVIGSNAIVTFDTTLANGYCQWPINNPIPSNQNPMNSIMAPYHDIDPSVPTPTSATDINWQVTGTAPCREFIVSWNDVAMFSCNNLIATSQMVLHETTNIIDIYIQDKPLCTQWNNGAAIEGIQDATGTNAYFVPGRNYPTQWTATNDGQRFMPTGAPQYTLNWTGPSGNLGSANPITVCPPVTSTYTCTVTNASCAGPIVVSASVTVTVTAGLTVTGSQTNSASCTACNGTATVTVTVTSGSGPFTYSWLPSGGNAATATNLCPGTYTATVTDQTGCTGTQTFLITGPSSPASSQSSTNVSCNGGCNGTATIVPNPAGTYSYTWSPNVANTATASGLCAGTYSVTATDQSGCTTTQTISITEPAAITVSTSTIPADCGNTNGSATAVASGGTGAYAYSWNTSPAQTTATANGLAAGSYVVTVTDANGCTATATATVNNTNNLVASVTSITNLSCFNSNDGAVVTNVTGGDAPFTYSWTPAVSTMNSASSLAAGTYTVTITDASGCSGTVTATVTQPADLSVGTAATPPAICAGASTQLSATATGGIPGYTYTWQPGALSGNTQTVSPASTTTYSVQVTDANGCVDSAVVQVTIHPQPVADFIGDRLSGCAEHCVRFTDLSSVTAPATIISGTWNFGDGSPLALLEDSAHCYAAAGMYDVTLNVISSDGCTASVTFPSYINVFPGPIAAFNASPQPATILTPQISFTDQSLNAVTWSWNFGDSANTISSLQNPTFTYDAVNCYEVQLAVTSADGCADTTTQNICIRPEVTIYVPNAFTPDGNGKNDIFIPVHAGLDPEKYELWIFDRWGNLVFHTTDVNAGWDGRMKGRAEPVQNDTYVWKIYAMDVLGIEHSEHGIVNLIK